jgi:hypothetical protein
MVEFDNALNTSKAELAERVDAKKQFLSESSLLGPVSHTIGDSTATIAALPGMILSECRRAVDAVVDDPLLDQASTTSGRASTDQASSTSMAGTATQPK